VLLLVFLAWVSGCTALKPVASSDDLPDCGATRCTILTESELDFIARHFYERGYKAGRKSL
jgi:hypothetical protein